MTMRRLLLILAACCWCSATPAQVLKPVQLAVAEGLSQPHDAALSPDGRLLYVTDMQASRIAVFEAMSLKPVGSFGKGELSYPHDAEFDARGRLLVADTGNDRIAIYEVSQGSGRLVGELRGLAGPEGVAVTADGRVLATNTRSGTLAVFRDGRLVQTVGRQGSGNGEFLNPHDVDVSADGRILVVDSGNNRVQVFDDALRHLASIGNAIGLSGPKYLGPDGARFWLADENNHRIVRLDDRLRMTGQLGSGRRGRAADAYYKPEAIVARGPLVWVIDTYNDRVLLLRVE